MNLKNKKKMISRVLGVGLDRIALNTSRLSEIKEIITRQDARELTQEGVIRIKEGKGRTSKEARKTKKRFGKKKKIVNIRKREYVRLTRKLRAYVANLHEKEKISKEKYYELRKKIKAKNFKSLAHLRETGGIK